ncbi:phage-related protein, tail component [Microbacterium testaceum StLB037]|uniref:Phage-related protein, tail component n=1 Tax=Microbacterium testaceum (strain StLB037) TaxID=979556 RepID=E8N7T0_MICTS|nr:phage-related protein, tail component [Microbacterium testaceum StLB037]
MGGPVRPVSRGGLDGGASETADNAEAVPRGQGSGAEGAESHEFRVLARAALRRKLPDCRTERPNREHPGPFSGARHAPHREEFVRIASRAVWKS